MAQEIERKYLVKGDDWRKEGGAQFMAQAYLSVSPERTVRIRIKGEKAWITIKGRTTGITRPEYEYSIPVDDARELMKMAEHPPVEKYRNEIWHEGVLWEVDEFVGENSGLVIAEVELDSEDQQLQLPSWIGEEVTHDSRYYNVSLAQKPFSLW